MKEFVTKGATLVLFASMIYGFVAYRSGWLGSGVLRFSGSPNGGALNIDSDSMPKQQMEQRVIMPSSKYMTLKQRQEGTKYYKLVTDSSEKVPYEDDIMSSSKSAIMFHPRDIPLIPRDSLETDTNEQHERH